MIHHMVDMKHELRNLSQSLRINHKRKNIAIRSSRLKAEKLITKLRQLVQVRV